ncbi:uncharacterized protein LOC143904226 isoform X1 [Temnothorax americanus]|uniref:uncharacterized protein LOC143904226 isoform X1 n=1 Tax=Temnothorax americanus TaxID=1964332 RepID=UPI004068A072
MSRAIRAQKSTEGLSQMDCYYGIIIDGTDMTALVWDDFYPIEESTPKRDKDNLLSRGAGLCFHIENTFIYVVSRRDELPNIAGYEFRLLSRRKRRPQRTKSSLYRDESSHKQDERRKEVWRHHEIS